MPEVSNLHIYRFPVAFALEKDSLELITDIMTDAVGQFGKYWPLSATLEGISQHELAQRFADNIANVCAKRVQEKGPIALEETYVQTRWLSNENFGKDLHAKVEVHFERGQSSDADASAQANSSIENSRRSYS